MLFTVFQICDQSFEAAGSKLLIICLWAAPYDLRRQHKEGDMAERIDRDGEEMDRLPPEEDDNDSDDEVDRLFELMHEGEEDEEEEEVEDEQPLDTESSESFELDTPAERSGHVAVIDRNTMYVWGGYKVSRS